MEYYMFAVGALALVALVVWLLKPSYAPDEPRPIPYTTPVLGNAIPWVKDRRAFFSWADKQSQQEPYTMLVAGQKHYVFTQPSHVAAIFRKSKTLSIKPFVELVHRNLMHMRKPDVEKIMPLTPAMHDIFSKYLLQPDNYNQVVTAYLKALIPIFAKIKEEVAEQPEQRMERDILDLLYDTMAPASFAAYFGHKALENDPNVGRDMATYFLTGFWRGLMGLPAYCMRDSGRAKDRIKESIRKSVMDPQEKNEDVSGFIKAMLDLTSPVLSEDGVATHEFSFVFGFLGNSLPTCYNTLVRILNVPGLIAEVQSEAVQSQFASVDISEKYQHVPQDLPLLRSCYYEAIRMHSVAASIREVLEPTEVTVKEVTTGGEPKTYQLKKGSAVNLPPSVLHYNATVNPDPENYHPKRFLSKELGGEGQNPSTSTRGFGGGASYCPGRVFAERQILGVIAMILLQFDVSLASERCTLPKTSDFDDVMTTPRTAMFLSPRKR